MKRIVLLFALSLLAACSFSPADSFQSARATVRLLDIPGVGNGSGVVIAPGKVLTANHVAVEVEHGLLLEPGRVPVATEKADENVDLALLGAPVACPCAKLAEYPAQEDEPVIVIGFPMNERVQLQILTRGAAQGVIGSQLALTAPVAGGNSGGGVFVWRDGEWQLVGILVATRGQGADAPVPIGVPVNYLSIAVDLETIRKFLDSHAG